MMVAPIGRESIVGPPIVRRVIEVGIKMMMMLNSSQ